jgi:hypothetical protein
MKLKIFVILLLGITITNQSYAATKPTASHKSVLDYFMESYLNTDYKMLREVLSKDAVFTSNRDVNVVKNNAADVLGLMKKNEGARQQDCHLKATILSKTDALVIARVDVKYDLYNGDQQNFVVIERDKLGEWRITQIYKMFVDSAKTPQKAPLS